MTNASTGKWVTRDGTEMLIADMDDNHLVNAFRMVLRGLRALATSHALSALRYAEDAPDGAALCAGMEGERILDASISEWAEDVIEMFADEPHGRKAQELYDEILERGLSQ